LHNYFRLKATATTQFNQFDSYSYLYSYSVLVNLSTLPKAIASLTEHLRLRCCVDYKLRVFCDWFSDLCSASRQHLQVSGTCVKWNVICI